MTLKVDMKHRVLDYYQVCSNGGSRLTLTYCTVMSNFIPYAFVWEGGKTVDFSETIVVYDIKVGRCSQVNDYMKQLNEYMKLYENQRSRSLTLVQISQIQYFLTRFPQPLGLLNQISCGASFGWGNESLFQMIQVT